MGKAYKAPDATYSRGRRVSKRAIAAFRDLAGREWLARPDGDLGNLLDEMVSSQAPYKVVTDTHHPDELTKVYAVEMNGETRYAVERDCCIVTMLSAVMVQKNLREGSWVDATNNDLEAHGEKPRPTVTPRPPAATPEPRPAPKVEHRRTSAPVPAPAPPPRPQAAEREELIIDIPVNLAAHGVKLVEMSLQLAVLRKAAREALAAHEATRAKLAAATEELTKAETAFEDAVGAMNRACEAV